LVDEILIAEFQSGLILETTKEHLFRVKDRTFVPIGVLEGKRVQGKHKTGKRQYDTVKRLEKSIEKVYVYNFRCDLGNYFVTNAERTFEASCHNSKPHTPIYY
jgi:hypothetical protein